jgi:hypothetical protein
MIKRKMCSLKKLLYKYMWSGIRSTDNKKRNSLHHQAQCAHFLGAIGSDILKKTKCAWTRTCVEFEWNYTKSIENSRPFVIKRGSAPCLKLSFQNFKTDITIPKLKFTKLHLQNIKLSINCTKKLLKINHFLSKIIDFALSM